MNLEKKVRKLFKKYEKELLQSLNTWLAENEYEPIEEFTDQIIVDLLDEVFCYFTGEQDLEYVFDEIDKDMLLGEYDWVVSTNED